MLPEAPNHPQSDQSWDLPSSPVTAGAEAAPAPGRGLGTAIPWLPGGVLPFPHGGISQGSPNPAFSHAGLSQNAPSQACPARGRPFSLAKEPTGVFLVLLHPVLLRGTKLTLSRFPSLSRREAAGYSRAQRRKGKPSPSLGCSGGRNPIPELGRSLSFPEASAPPAPSGSEVFRMAGMRMGGDLHAELLNSPFPGNSMQGAKGKEDFRNGNLGWA